MAISSRSLPLEKVSITDYINILTVDELREHGIRSAIYPASCVDKEGLFAHEEGYCSDRFEPFVRRIFVLRCLPKIWSSNPRDVKPTIGKIHSGVKLDGKEFSVEKIVEEIKEHMEYVCLVRYALAPCLCGSSRCTSKHFSPIVGGLTKKRYRQYLKELNE
jgi:hypothetical protein